MQSTPQSVDRVLRDCLRELVLDLEDAFGEWVAASTRIDLEDLAFTGKDTLAEWLDVPESTLAGLRAISQVITKGTEPLTVEWGQFRSEVLATIAAQRVELEDWRRRFLTR